MATTTKTRQRSTSDAVEKYARAVVAGKTVAGPHVRDACQRHLTDLQHAAARGLVFDQARAKRAIGFFRDVLRLNGGEFEAQPYELLPWQAFIIGSLFGWVDQQGMRRFRVAYIETGKGSGKSPLAAGIGLYALVADGEFRAEVYAAATKKDQAMVLFRDAVAMVDQSPELRKRLTKSGVGHNTWNLAYMATGSFFRPISADDGNSGPRPHVSLIDEVHEHRNGYVVEMLKAGQKGRRQPLTLMITNSGTDKRSVCWDYHQYGAEVAAGKRKDDTFFSYVCALDEGDEPFKNRKCWAKANPSLGVTITNRYLDDQIRQAKGMPSKESVVRRLNFCQWTESAAPWISGELWTSRSGRPGADLAGRTCWAGLDLSSTQDLTALVLLFEPTDADPVWRMVPHFWLPAEGLHDKADQDRVPYIAWRDAGHLQTTPGRAISRLHVLRRIVQLCDQYAVRGIGYDRWRIEDLRSMVADEGLTLPELIDVGQGYKDMAPAVDEFERRLLSGSLLHDANPVMTWCASNAVIDQDPAGNRKITKARAIGRVDGIVAAIMATKITMTPADEGDFAGFLAAPIRM